MRLVHATREVYHCCSCVYELVRLANWASRSPVIVAEQLTRHNPLIHLQYCRSWLETQVLIDYSAVAIFATQTDNCHLRWLILEPVKGHTTTVTCRWLVVSHLFGTTSLHWHSIHNNDTFAVHANILSSMHSFLSPLLHLIIFSRIQHLCVCACVRAIDCPFAQHEPLPQPPPAAAAQVLDASLDIVMLWDGHTTICDCIEVQWCYGKRDHSRHQHNHRHHWPLLTKVVNGNDKNTPYTEKNCASHFDSCLVLRRINILFCWPSFKWCFALVVSCCSTDAIVQYSRQES